MTLKNNASKHKTSLSTKFDTYPYLKSNIYIRERVEAFECELIFQESRDTLVIECPNIILDHKET